MFEYKIHIKAFFCNTEVQSVALNSATKTQSVNFATSFCVPQVPKSVLKGNVIDTLLSSQRKETQGNMARKIDLAYLLSQPPQISSQIKNMLCAGQITWHGRVKQRAATASHTSPARDTYHSDGTPMLPRALTVRTM